MKRNSHNTRAAVTDQPETALTVAAREVIMRKCRPHFAPRLRASAVIKNPLNDLLHAAVELVHIVEGVRDWRDIAPKNGIVRLKDTPEWCRFYVALGHVKYP